MAETADFAEASKTAQIDSHTYTGYVPKLWSMKGIAQGGFAVSLLLSATNLHFNTTHSSLNQPHTFSIQAQLLRPTPTGPVKIRIDDTKLGKGLSTIHATLLTEKGGEDVVTIVAYLSRGNFRNLKGDSVHSPYSSTLPALPPKSTSTETMLEEKDPNWSQEFHRQKYEGIVPFMTHCSLFSPRKGMLSSCLSDRWAYIPSTISSTGWCNDLIPFMADLPWMPLLGEQIKKGKWLATLSFNVDFKRAIGKEGGEGEMKWLLTRKSTSNLTKGKFDLNDVIIDEEGEVVALATQCMMLVGEERRAGRKSSNGEVSKM